MTVKAEYDKVHVQPENLVHEGVHRARLYKLAFPLSVSVIVAQMKLVWDAANLKRRSSDTTESSNSCLDLAQGVIQVL